MRFANVKIWLIYQLFSPSHSSFSPNLICWNNSSRISSMNSIERIVFAQKVCEPAKRIVWLYSFSLLKNLSKSQLVEEQMRKEKNNAHNRQKATNYKRSLGEKRRTLKIKSAEIRARIWTNVFVCINSQAH